MKGQLSKGKYADFKIGTKGELRINEHLCVPKVGDIREAILEKAHKSSLCNASENHENVPDPPIPLLVANDEKGCGRVRSKMPNLPTNKKLSTKRLRGN